MPPTLKKLCVGAGGGDIFFGPVLLSITLAYGEEWLELES